MNSVDSGSRTVVETSSSSNQPFNSVTILKLRSRNKKNVEWDSDVVDNEHLNKKNSKCKAFYIFHYSLIIGLSLLYISKKERIW